MRYLLICCVLCVALTSDARADLITNWASFNNAFAGLKAVDVLAGGVDLTHISINGSSNPADHSLGGNGSKVGVNTGNVQGGNDARSWSDGESWTFSWNAPTTFGGINFNSLTGGDAFTLRSDSFIGLGAIATGSGVNYDSVAGSFTFTNVSSDNFGLAAIGGAPLGVALNDAITISYSGTSSADLSSFTFTAAVPEPSSVALLGSVACIYMVRRRRS